MQGSAPLQQQTEYIPLITHGNHQHPPSRDRHSQAEAEHTESTHTSPHVARKIVKGSRYEYIPPPAEDPTAKIRSTLQSADNTRHQYQEGYCYPEDRGRTPIQHCGLCHDNDPPVARPAGSTAMRKLSVQSTRYVLLDELKAILAVKKAAAIEKKKDRQADARSTVTRLHDSPTRSAHRVERRP